MNLILKISILEKFHRQADFAQKAGIEESLLSKIVNGRRSPTVEQRQAISKTLGIDASELFSCQN
jgi:transcriptional regulator with XRE-family HTH domain